MLERDYYEVLGVSHDETGVEIRRAFRKLAMQYHPDRNKEPDAEKKFKDINEAYQVLSDPAKRQQYDQFGHSDQLGQSYPPDFFTQGFATDMLQLLEVLEMQAQLAAMLSMHNAMQGVRGNVKSVAKKVIRFGAICGAISAVLFGVLGVHALAFLMLAVSCISLGFGVVLLRLTNRYSKPASLLEDLLKELQNLER